MTVGTYVTAEGLTIPTVAALIALINAEARSEIDPNVGVAPEDPAGQLIGIFVSHEREAWEALQIAYGGFDPDAAEGFLLEAICAITGTYRAAATASSFFGPRKVQLTLGSNGSVPAGVILSVVGAPTITVITTENAEAGLGGGVIYVAARCTVTGPVQILAGTLTIIQTPVVGLLSATNPSDAFLGTNRETDSELRARRVRELDVAAAGNPAAITAALLAYATEDLVKPILDAVTYENTGDVFDSDGRPPHSVESVVYDGDTATVDNDIIAQIIWDNRGGGIATYGTTSGNAIDYRGITRIVRFSRAAIEAVKVEVTLTYDALKPPPSATVIKSACVTAHTNASKLGNTTLRWSIFDAATEDFGGNVLGCDSIRLGPAAGTYLAPFVNLPLPARTKTSLQSTNVTVIMTPGAP